jgi:predicted  nucleic acid-binding Zn-ribbon protein
MQNLATFWLEQWLKFLSAAGGWQATDRDAFDSQIAQLRAAAANADAELKAVADERRALQASLDRAAGEAGERLRPLEAEIARLRAELEAAVAGRAAAEDRSSRQAEEIESAKAAAARTEGALAAAAGTEQALKLELDKARDLAVHERRQFAEEIGRLQKKADAAAAAAADADGRCAAAEKARIAEQARAADLAGRLERAEADGRAAAARLAAAEAAAADLAGRLQAAEARLADADARATAAEAAVAAAHARAEAAAADLVRITAAALSEREALEERLAAAATAAPAAAQPSLGVHFRKPDDWAGSIHCHYWGADKTGTVWPGKPMQDLGDGWFRFTIPGLAAATIVFNDTAGHQTPDLNRDRDGWYDGRWTNDRPAAGKAATPGAGKAAAPGRKPRKPAGG